MDEKIYSITLSDGTVIDGLPNERKQLHFQGFD